MNGGYDVFKYLLSKKGSNDLDRCYKSTITS